MKTQKTAKMPSAKSLKLEFLCENNHTQKIKWHAGQPPKRIPCNKCLKFAKLKEINGNKV